MKLSDIFADRHERWGGANGNTLLLETFRVDWRVQQSKLFILRSCVWVYKSSVFTYESNSLIPYRSEDANFFTRVYAYERVDLLLW